VAATAVGMSAGRAWFCFVPGYLASKEDFYALMAVLAERGVGSVAVDLRGQQDSDPAGAAVDCSLVAMASDVRAVGERVRADWAVGPGHLVGHSMGGLVAQHAVGDSTWSSLTLVCSGGAALPQHRTGILALVRRYLPTVSREVLWDRKVALERATGVDEPAPDVAAFERSRWMRHDATALVEGARILMEAESAPLANPSPPTTVVWGDRDDGWPVAHQDDLAVRWKARTIVLRDAGHQPHLDAPASVAAVLLGDLRTPDGQSMNSRPHPSPVADRSGTVQTHE